MFRAGSPTQYRRRHRDPVAVVSEREAMPRLEVPFSPSIARGPSIVRVVSREDPHRRVVEQTTHSCPDRNSVTVAGVVGTPERFLSISTTFPGLTNFFTCVMVRP